MLGAFVEIDRDSAQDATEATCVAPKTGCCLFRQVLVAHEGEAPERQKPLHMRAFAATRRRTSMCQTRPVTPEVAGPNAPASKAARLSESAKVRKQRQRLSPESHPGGRQFESG